MLKKAKEFNAIFVDGKKLIDSSIDKISFQIGGTNQETHQIYRVNGNLEKRLNNISEAVERKKETEASTKIILGFILMKHNEYQINDFWKLAKELEVDRKELISPCVRTTIEQGKRFLPNNGKYWHYNNKEAFEKKGDFVDEKQPRKFLLMDLEFNNNNLGWKCFTNQKIYPFTGCLQILGCRPCSDAKK